MNLPRSRNAKLKFLAFLFVILLVVCFIVKFNHGRSDNNRMIEFSPLLQDILKITQKAGNLVIKIRKSELEIVSKGETDEGAKDIVTNADMASHNLIKEFFELKYKGITFLSEESYDEAIKLVDKPKDNPKYHFNIKKSKASDLTVIIDPLDATKEYSENLLEYNSIMACVLNKGTPFMGVIHFPYSNISFWAWLGVGDSKNFNEAKLLVKNLDEFTSDKVKIVVSRSHKGSVESKIKSIIKADTQFKIIEAGGSGYKATLALGSVVDIYIHVTKIKIWDICAPYVLAKQLGANIYNIDKEKIEFNIFKPVLDSGIIFGKNVKKYIN